MKSSQKSGFYTLSIKQRLDWLQAATTLESSDLAAWAQQGGLTVDQAEHMIENVVGQYALPLGLGLNFQINGKDVIIPMVVEEPSIVAGASYMAKLVRKAGGFQTTSTEPVMIGQIQVLDVQDMEEAISQLEKQKESLLTAAAEIDPILNQLGGGPRDLEIRIIETSPIGPFLVVHILFDVRDAMGANAVNTACERLAPMIEHISKGRVHLKILSNLADHRLVKANCKVRLEDLAFDDFSAEEVRDGILEAWAFAAADPYRAATHNKGIMNGVDAVVLATGNDWRAVEAGAHAYAAKDGIYTSLSTWSKDDEGNLLGSLELPMAVGIVGGATRVHPGAKAALKLMDIHTARELAEIIGAVGLAQNLAAIRALATEGIQRGHMNLHARQVAISAGAKGEQIEKLAASLVAEKKIRIDRAEEIMKEWSQNER